MAKKYFNKSKQPEILDAEVASVTVVEVAPEPAAEAAPKANIVSRAVYGAFYGVSYGVVFGSLLVAKVIPKNSLIESAIHDGATAARVAVKAEPAVAAETVDESVPSFEEGAAVAA